MEIPKSVAEYISKHGLSNTGSRVLFFLLQHPEPVSTKDISAAVGVSPKTINKAIRKLKDAGIIERGELEAQKRRFVIPGATIPPPEPDELGAKYELLRERMESLETQNKTMMEILVSIKHQITTPEIPKVTTYTPEISPRMDSSAPQAEPLNISLSKLASLKESLTASSLQPCEEFRALFGVQVPIGADLAAVNEMIRRKKSGKLENVKSPLGYLASITGKVGPSVTPSAAVPTTCRPMLEAVDMRRIELERRAREMWNKMGDGEKKPFMDHGSKVKESRYKTPIELLARSEFTRQMLSQHGFAI